MSRHPNDKPTPSAEVAALLARMRETFGKGKRPKKEPTDNEIARKRNLKWHEANKPVEGGAVAARPNPEDSAHWKPIAKETHLYIQECANCSNVVEYTGGEYVIFRSIFGLNGGECKRKAEHCPTLFLTNDLQKPLEERFTWHYETVVRCPGCIMVHQQAEAILWDEHLRQQAKALLTDHKVIDIVNPLPRSMDEALKPSERETK